MKNKLTKTKEVVGTVLRCRFLEVRLGRRDLAFVLLLAGTILSVLCFCPSCSSKNFLLYRILSNDIVFYGQVLDLEGNPVPNAEVEYSSLNSVNFGDVWVGGIPSKTMQADENGRFEIHETGGSLFVACEHQDYYSTYDHAEESRRKFGYGFQVGDDPACDPKNPAIFRLHKKGVREPLYYSCSQVISKGQQWIQIPEEPYVINLANGEAQESPTSIYISYKSDRLEDERRGYAWGYTLCIPGGGFIEKSDRRDFLAPEEGYEEEIRIECLRESEDWNIWKRSFYLGTIYKANQRREGR